MQLKANCKINLGLHVLRRREDGYHELETVMLPVAGLYDIIDIEPQEGDDILFASRGIIIDCPEDKNLCVRAARLMQERYSTCGVRITLHKRVPFGAGLGGGSSDATAVIVAMNDIFELGLDKATLAAHAAELGSDTPFFVYNTPQLCTGRGEIMHPIDVDLSGLWLAVVKREGESVSTKEAYSGIMPRIPEHSLTELLRHNREEWQHSIVNDFEPHIFLAHPTIAELKSRLLDAGALYAAMSGSGAALFALYRERPMLNLPEDTFIHIEQL